MLLSLVSDFLSPWNQSSMKSEKKGLTQQRLHRPPAIRARPLVQLQRNQREGRGPCELHVLAGLEVRAGALAQRRGEFHEDGWEEVFCRC